uniref:tetratricopeptide repeat protein n=1 Tax=Roseivirga sp. TaxID=1964215 RepID=UPI004048D46C
MEKDLELIDAYLRGELSGIDLARFDEKLRNDVEFQSTFLEIKLIKTAIRQNLRANALQFLKDQESLIQENYSTKNRNIMKKYLSIAASLVLVVTLVYLTSSNKTIEIDGQAIFSENYQAYTNLELGTERGAEVDLSSLKQQAYYAYDLGNFGQAAADLTELVKSEKTAANYFYLGISNLEIGNSEASFANFNTVINNFSEYKEQAQWYLSLTLLKEDKIDEALSNLVSLVVERNSYEERSLKILSEKFGIGALDLLDGTVVVEDIIIQPKDENNSPSGLSFEDRRQVQFGTLVDIQSGDKYSFFNDEPISDLGVGDMVKVIIVQRGKKGQKSKGYAYIIGKI